MSTVLEFYCIYYLFFFHLEVYRCNRNNVFTAPSSVTQLFCRFQYKNLIFFEMISSMCVTIPRCFYHWTVYYIRMKSRIQIIFLMNKCVWQRAVRLWTKTNVFTTTLSPPKLQCRFYWFLFQTIDLIALHCLNWNSRNLIYKARRR